MLEKTLQSPLDSKEIKPVNAKGNQSWIFIGRTDAEAGTPILCPPDVKNWHIVKDPDAEKDWRQEEKGTTGWDGWMASPTRWTWVSVNSGSWWWTGRPGVLRFMGSQRVGPRLSDWSDLIYSLFLIKYKFKICHILYGLKFTYFKNTKYSTTLVFPRFSFHISIHSSIFCLDENSQYLSVNYPLCAMETLNAFYEFLITIFVFSFFLNRFMWNIIH